MRRGALAVGAILAALSLSGCDEGRWRGAFRDSVDLSRPLDAHGRLTLENTNGRVSVSVWDQASVRIEAHKRAASRRALERLEVAVDGEGGEVTVRTRQQRAGVPFFGGGAVDYTITVPRGASVRARTVNGRIEIDGVSGRVEAATTNGSIDASDLGSGVEASTTNGSIAVHMARVEGGSRNELRTTNGSVRLVLPGDAGAEVEARTTNGSTSCEFDLAEARRSRRRLEGRIGAGGARFELRTVNGSARIERGLAASGRPVAEASSER